MVFYHHLPIAFRAASCLHILAATGLSFTLHSFTHHTNNQTGSVQRAELIILRREKEKNQKCETPLCSIHSKTNPIEILTQEVSRRKGAIPPLNKLCIYFTSSSMSQTNPLWHFSLCRMDLHVCSHVFPCLLFFRTFTPHVLTGHDCLPISTKI